MAIGYFIHKGDKTDCGGEVIEGEEKFTLNGVARARVGDRVTCGKDGKDYVIEGGVAGFKLNNRISAGSLDSFSSCPCRARLLPLHTSFKYEKATSQTSAQSAAQPDNYQASATRRYDSTLGSHYGPAQPAPVPPEAACDQCLQFINHQHLPIGHADYVLLQDDQCIAYGKLDEHGHSRTYSSVNPTELQLAINAQLPILE